MERSMSAAVLGLKEAGRVSLWAFGFCTGLVCALALVALVQSAVDVGSLGAPLDWVMAEYAAITQWAFAWVEPYLQEFVASIDGYVNWRLTLHPYWKDAFVLFAVYGAAYARACFVSDEFKFQPRLVIRPIVLAVAVLFAAVVVGVLPLRSTDVVTEIVIFSLPVGMYSFGFMDWHDFVQTLLFTLYLVCTAAVLAWLMGDAFGFAQGLGFWSLTLWVLGNGMTLIARGLISPERRYAWVRVGLVIVGGFVGAACFFAIDAGLKLLAA
jgi:hypothetical protein